MKKNRLLLCAGMAALALLSSSCANQTGKSESGNAKDDTLNVSADPVTLTFAISMGWLGPDEFRMYFEEPVRKRYPNITLEVIDMSKPEFTLDKIIAGGTVPDIVMTASPLLYRLLGTGVEYNMEPLIQKFKFDLSKYNQIAIESVKTASQKNELIGLPWSMHFSALYYNQDIFNKFGVPYPKDGMTWEEVRELAKKLTRYENGVQYRGLEPDKSTRVASVLSYGFIDPKTEKATVNNDNWKRIFELLKSIYDIPGNDKFGLAGAGYNQFVKDRTLAMLATVNILPNMKEAQDLNWDMAQYPSFGELKNTGMQVDEWILHVTAQSKHKDQAFQVISTVLSDDVQTEIAKNGRFPVLTGKSVEDVFGSNLAYAKGKHLQAAFMTKPAKALPVSKYDSFAEDRMASTIGTVVKGEKDINTILREAEEAINANIEANKDKK